MTVEEAIQRLQMYEPNTELAVAIWSANDVLSFAWDNDIDITEDQADEVIARVHLEQEADKGINWDVIEYTIREVVG